MLIARLFENPNLSWLPVALIVALAVIPSILCIFAFVYLKRQINGRMNELLEKTEENAVLKERQKNKEVNTDRK
jgi:hypothetical protein